MSGDGKDLAPLSEYDRDRVRQAYAMKLAGKHLVDIADELGFASASDVSAAIRHRFRLEVRDITSEGRESLTQLELDRLDALQEGLWLSATLGDLRSVQLVLNIITLRAKLLKLDLPDATTGQQTVLIIGGQEQEYIEKLKELTDG